MTLMHTAQAILIAGIVQVSSGTIHGTAHYSATGTLPANATFDATLQDVSRADATASVIATTRIPSPGASPLRFTIAYDPSKITDRGRYVVRAQIRADDRLLFTSDTATPVITNGHPTTVAITLRPVPNRQPNSSSSAAQEPGTLEGTSWTAVEVYGTPVTPQVASPDRDPHLVFGAGGRVAGADGCNRLTGPYTVKGNGITFGDLAGTQMACPKTDELARRFRAALKGTGHWSLVKGRLEFYGATGKPLVVFERRPSPAPSGEAALQGTRWQLVRFQGGDDRTIVPPDPSSYTLEFTSGGQLAARIDCNRGRGTWKATPAGQLELGALSLTRMKCPDGSLHDQMVKHWPSVRSFVMKDGHLFLSLMADGGTYEFAPVGAAKQ